MLQKTHVDIQKGKLLGKMIDPETGLGPLSAEIIAGTQDLYAPRCFQLKNEVIMQMRSEKMYYNYLIIEIVADMQTNCSGSHGSYKNMYQEDKSRERLNFRKMQDLLFSP